MVFKSRFNYPKYQKSNQPADPSNTPTHIGAGACVRTTEERQRGGARAAMEAAAADAPAANPAATADHPRPEDTRYLHMYVTLIDYLINFFLNYPIPSHFSDGTVSTQ